MEKTEQSVHSEQLIWIFPKTWNLKLSLAGPIQWINADSGFYQSRSWLIYGILSSTQACTVQEKGFFLFVLFNLIEQ